MRRRNEFILANRSRTQVRQPQHVTELVRQNGPDIPLARLRVEREHEFEVERDRLGTAFRADKAVVSQKVIVVEIVSVRHGCLRVEVAYLLIRLVVGAVYIRIPKVKGAELKRLPGGTLRLSMRRLAWLVAPIAA